MGDSKVFAARWKEVQVGRVVLFSSPSPYEGRIAVIVNIVDPKHVLVDGPSEDDSKRVPRHNAPLSSLQLTSIVIEKLPFGIRTGALKAKWEKAEVEKKWTSGVFAAKREKSAKRRALNDFERFKVLRLLKQRRFEHRKSFAKIKASAS